MNSLLADRMGRQPSHGMKTTLSRTFSRTTFEFDTVRDKGPINRADRAQACKMGMSTSLLVVLCLIMAGCQGREPAPRSTPVTFALTERFGVSHPDQIVTFDLARAMDAQAVVMVGPDGVPVPWQWLDNGARLAVRTALAPGESRTWRLVDARDVDQAFAGGHPTDGVTLAETGTYYELVNGLTGVRIPKPPESLATTPAPVHAVRLRTGAWAPEGNPPALSRQAQAMEVRILERGPLRVVVEVDYRFAGDDAYYRSRIELQAGQPSILFEEDANTRVSWSLELYDAVAPDQARYRGHHARSVRDGYEEDGRQYRQWHQRPSMDAFVDLTFDQPRSYRSIAVWDPWRFNTGWYWQMYDTDAGDDASVVGMFAGRASRAVNAGASGVGAFSGTAAIQDLVTASDDEGAIHAIYRSGGELWHAQVDRQLALSEPTKIAQGLVNPDLALLADGSLSVVAYDPQAEQFVALHGRAGETFTRQPVTLTGAGEVAVADPYAYQAVRGDTHFLFFHGERDGTRQGLLFSRTVPEQAFIFRDAIGAPPDYRQIYRPVFETLADGRAMLITTDRGGYVNQRMIKPDATTFHERVEFARVAGSPLNFGVAIDRNTGTFAVVDHPEGNLREYPLDGEPTIAPLKQRLDHHGQGANRRTLAIASASDGTAVLLQGGNDGNEYRHSAYRKREGQWETWLDAEDLAMAAARVHDHPPTGQFVLIGRKDGQLTVEACPPDAERPQPASHLPQTERRTAGVTMNLNPGDRGQSRFQWGLFVGTKGEHLLEPTDTQPINRQMNLHGGFNLDKISRYQLDLPEPPDGFGALYMPREALERMIEKLRADGRGPHGRGFHTYLYNADPTIRPLIDMWVDESGEKTREQARHVVSEARRILDLYVNDGGIYHMGVHYWHGGLAMSRLTVWIDQVLASDALGDELRAQVEAAAALFGYILWDDDFVPLHGGHGLNLGTANMPVQQTGYRHQYALLLHQHPDFGERAAGVAEAALRDVHATINEHGAHMGSSHYLGASMGPLLNTLVQLKRAGIHNAFADEPRLRRFADFYMQFVTPPDPRYENLRIRIPTGNAEANNPQFLAGVLGTAFADVDPELSARLMGSWAQSGKPHTGFHVSTLLMTDEELPQADPALGGDTFPGFFSVLRSGWGEPHEAAAWLVGGRWYRDHRNHGEHGMVSLYAHAAPLALNWGPMYSPYAPSALLRNTLLPANSDWKAVPVPHEGGPGDWSTSALDAFTPAADGGMAQCTASGFGGEWTRNVRLHDAGDGWPVFLIDDRFSDVPLVFSLAMAAEDAVQTPEGERKPGEGFTLPVGVSHLDFTGQPLEEHPTGGIDWRLFVVADAPREAFLTEWRHGNRRGQRQVILRITGEDAFRVAIVPWPKGRRPESMEVRERDGQITLELDGRQVDW